MELFADINWHELFGISLPVAEIIIRGTAVYWFLFLIFRFVIRRDVGAVGIADILILVIVADASQNAMSGEYKSVGDGIILVSTLIGWNVLLDWLSYRFPVIQRLVEPSLICLVKDGNFIKKTCEGNLLPKKNCGPNCEKLVSMIWEK